MFTEDASWVHTNMFVQPARVQQQQPPQPKSARRGHKRRYNEGPGVDTDPRAPRPLFSPHPPPMSAHNPPLGHPEDTSEGSAGTFRGNGHHGHDHDQGQAPLTHGPPSSEQGRRDAAWRAAQRSSARPSRQGQDTAPSTFRQSQPEPQPYKKPRVRQGDAASRPAPSSPFSQSSHPSQSSQFYHPTASSASGSQPVDPDFAHFEQERDSMGEPTMRVGPCPSTADSPPPAYSSFQLGRPPADDGEQSHKASARSDRRSKQRSDRATRQQTEVAAAQPTTLNGRTHHKVTVLMEDQRPGRDCVLAEVFVFVAESGGQLFVDAHDISDELQKSAQRIEGPAKLYTFRGKWKQYFLRVGMFYDPAVPVESTHQSLMLRVDENGPKALLLDVFIEEDTSARPPNCWQCGAPCQPDVLADVPHPRTSRASTREQEELMRAASRPRSTSEIASPRSSYTAERPASTRPVESRHHSRRSTVQEPLLTPVSSRSQTKAPAADIRRTNTAQQQEPQSSSWLEMLATQAQDRISPVSDEDDEEDDDDVYDDLGDLGDFMPEGVALPSHASDASARTPSVRGTPAFGASGFGASFFEKYSKQGASLVPPSAPKLLVNPVTRRPHPTEPDGVDAAVIAHLRQLLEQDPRWARFESYRTEAPQFKFLREMCYWVHEQVTMYAGKTVDVSPAAPSVTITRDHVLQAASFFPAKCRDTLDDLIAMDQKYGPNGTDGEDSTVMACLEEAPSVATEFALRHYFYAILGRASFRKDFAAARGDSN